MFEKVKRFAKKIATSKKTQMTCLMMVCGVTALMAQTGKFTHHCPPPFTLK